MSLISKWIKKTKSVQPSAAFLSACWSETEKSFFSQPNSLSSWLSNIFKVGVPAILIMAGIFGFKSYQSNLFVRQSNQELIEMDNSMAKLEQSLSSSIWDSINE